MKVGQSGQIYQNEGQLESTPTAVRRSIDIRELAGRIIFSLFHPHRTNALLPHGSIRKAERFACVRVCFQQSDAFLEALEKFLCAGHNLAGSFRVVE